MAAEVIYCNDLLTYLGSPDTEFQMTVAQAYNDWIHELFGSRPDRLAPAAILPTLDVPAAVKKPTGLPSLASAGQQPHRHQEPALQPQGVRAAMECTGGDRLVFSLHFNSGTEDHLPDKVGEEDDDNGFLPYMIISMAEGIEPVSHMLASGVPMRYPGLDFVVVECGAGWLRGCVCAGRTVPAEAHVGRTEAGVEPERLF